MEYHRFEILPNVFLSCVKTNKFKTGTISMFLLATLERKNASLNALFPRVLRRGTAQYPDMSRIADRLDELYGASIEADAHKFGEIQLTGFRATFCDEKYTPCNEDITAGMISLMSDMLLRPVTKGGLLLQNYVDSEKEKLCEEIDSLINNKRSYAISRMISEMCAYENFGTFYLGDTESAESIYYVNLSKHYRAILSSAPIEIFYCGSRDSSEVAELFHDALITIPRGDPDCDLGTDIRMNTVEEKPRVFVEHLPVKQGQLVLGFRLGSVMEEPEMPVLHVLNYVYGGCSSSKLFMNIREKMSLCYTTGSRLYIHKGILAAFAGIDFDKYEIVRDEMLRQLDNIKKGEISQSELESAKKEAANMFRLKNDAPEALENYYLSSVISGNDYSSDEMAAAIEQVTLSDVVRASQGIALDQIYFLCGMEDK